MRYISIWRRKEEGSRGTCWKECDHAVQCSEVHCTKRERERESFCFLFNFFFGFCSLSVCQSCASRMDMYVCLYGGLYFLYIIFFLILKRPSAWMLSCIFIDKCLLHHSTCLSSSSLFFFSFYLFFYNLILCFLFYNWKIFTFFFFFRNI